MKADGKDVSALVAQARKTVEQAEEGGRYPLAAIKALKTALRLMEQSEKIVTQRGEWVARRKRQSPPGAKRSPVVAKR